MIFMSRGIFSSRMQMLYRLIVTSILANTARRCNDIFSIEFGQCWAELKA